VATHADGGRRYVGITNGSLSTRKSTHASHARTEKHPSFFHQAIRAYGVDSFSWKVVATGEETVIRLLENALIATYGTNDPKHGFNSKGGREWIDRPPLTEQPVDYSELHGLFGGDVAILQMMNDLDRIVSWVERNHPNADRCIDLRGLGRRLITRLDQIDPAP